MGGDRWGLGWGGATALVALVLLGSAFVGSRQAGGEGPRSVTIPLPTPFQLATDVHFVPQALPPHARAPVGLRFSLEVLSEGHARIPQLREVILEFGQAVDVETEGLAVCPAATVRAADVEAVCRDASVGSGRSEFEFALPEQTGPFTSPGEVTVVNSGGGPRRSRLYALGSVTIPSPAAVVIPMWITRSLDLTGTRLEMRIPRVGGGSGALLDLDLAFPRGTRDGSLFAARCRRGELRVDVIAHFTDGSLYEARLRPPCNARIASAARDR